MIEKRHYATATLEDALSHYETEYGMTSAEFFEAHRTDGDAVRGIPGFQRGVWSSLWQELQEFDAPEAPSTSSPGSDNADRG